MNCSTMTIDVQGAVLAADLTLPSGARGLVVLVHDVDRTRMHAADGELARQLEEAGLATLRIDLLSAGELDRPPADHDLWTDTALHARRLTAAIDAIDRVSTLRGLPLALVGAGAGLAAAACAAQARPERVRALVLHADEAAAASPDPGTMPVPTLAITTVPAPERHIEAARWARDFLLPHLTRARRSSGTRSAREQLPTPTFRHRQHAGAQLAAQLVRYARRTDVLVLAIPRGGLPVAAEMASILGLPLDVVVTRRLSAPGFEQLTLGSVGPGGVLVCDHALAPRFSPSELDAEIARQRLEVQSLELRLRGQRPPPQVSGKTVLLVDDGMISGATMRTAVAWARVHLAARVVVAVPVAPAHTITKLALEADEVVCLASPAELSSVTESYAETFDLDISDLAAQLARASVSRAIDSGVDRVPERP